MADDNQPQTRECISLPFSEHERAVLLAVQAWGPTVFDDWTQIGIFNALRARNCGDDSAEEVNRSRPPNWLKNDLPKNSPQAKAGNPKRD